MGQLKVTILEEFADENLMKALGHTKYVKGEVYDVLAFGSDKVFIRIEDRIIDIFASKLKIVG